jgi:hypothetical protein
MGGGMDPWGPTAITGLAMGQAPATATNAIPGIGRSAGPTSAMSDKPWSPDSPLFWFAVVAAATFGLMAANVHIKVGPFKAGVSAGKSS